MGVGEELGDDGGFGEDFGEGGVGVAEGGDLAFLLVCEGLAGASGVRNIWEGGGDLREGEGGGWSGGGVRRPTGLILRNHSSRGWLRSMKTSS